MKKKVLFLTTLILIIFIAIVLQADNGGVGDQNTNCIQCHYNSSSNAYVQFGDIPESVAPGEEVTIQVGVNLDQVSGNIPGVMLLTGSNQIIQNGGWTILEDPNGNSNPYNYNEAYGVSGNYIFAWILEAPQQEGSKTIKARLEYGHSGIGRHEETPTVTIEIEEDTDVKDSSWGAIKSKCND
jgi:hypothetical protein